MSELSRPVDPFPREELIRLLRALSLPFAACLVFFFVTPGGLPAFVRSRPDTHRQLIGVVESQFAAFRDGDYARAHAHASAGIRQQMSVAAFERMVKDGYPIIAYWRAISFGEAHDNGREAVLVVSVRGRSGRSRFFRYVLVREAGEWCINGVVEILVSPARLGQSA